MTAESTGAFVESSPTNSTTESRNVASSVDEQQRLSLRKGRKLSRVFTEFSLLASKKTVENPKIPPHNTTGFTAHDQIETRANPKSPDGTPSPPTSSMSPSSTRAIKADTASQANELISKAETTEGLPRLLTPSIPQIRPPRLSEFPPPPSSLRHTSRLTRKQRKSLDLRQIGGSQLPTRSSSLRISDMRRPASHKRWPDCPPDILERPALPEAYNHYLEVKRARKMTQLFGQELPAELLRITDKGRKTDYPQNRRNSTSSLESILSTPETGDKASSVEEDIIDISSPELPHGGFQERRRRVTKLSQFFGVSHSEIASSVVNAKPDDRTTFSLDVEPQKYASAAIVEQEVGVKIVSRRRWGLGEDMRDVELSDAITRLRGLRSI
ncbi:hypothetical protein AGABI2DRAFT_114222 [Agaricus bisporus var. bisporus H97]|uniref:hypothetical protein n=1 Tax=Agaricus bisporus var. bisporus (strain H97 / ATCC MYA-4626 / FGSC 10389) TaxID=936046 RepID=UPI00029F763B|nr:hypothetical protein AGABI2DRAFT_114222 [Agaricus bisporus var. bisporus H97]EKV51486.1 hypothetical protein AGABI2DRAFT_114222 [Agaricus bisporus var. bisporus H97]